ncbi:semaphorin-4D-like [Thomomys bottae]
MVAQCMSHGNITKKALDEVIFSYLQAVFLAHLLQISSGTKKENHFPDATEGSSDILFLCPPCFWAWIDGELYAGTTYNFLGSEFIISRTYFHTHLRTESDIPWLHEPNFVHAEVIRKSPSGVKGDENKVYFFFTELSVEYDFFFQLKIPRIARVCVDDQGGQKILQNKWTSFLKAKLLCFHSDLGLFFNVLQDAFILRPPADKEPVIYALFTSQLNSVGLSAICTYSLSTVEAVFSHGNYMQNARVDFYPKWLIYHGKVPKPRPGMCINSQTRAANYNSSLHLPDRTLLFVREHPLVGDSVTPIGNRPTLVKKDVSYTQIVVDRTQALDGTFYDVMFIGTGGFEGFAVAMCVSLRKKTGKFLMIPCASMTEHLL